MNGMRMTGVQLSVWKKWRLVKTVCMVATWLSAGMYMSMVGPALIDLTEIAHCNYEQLAYPLTAKNLGLTASALAAGWICSRYQRHLEAILATNLILLGLATAAVPWCSLLTVMAAAMMVQGLTHGVLGVAGNSWIAVMWEGESSGPLHALHFGNSLGSVVAPLIIRPFLSPDVNSSLPKHEIGLPGNILGNNSSTVASSRIQIPFGAYGLYTLFWGGLFLWFYVNDRQTPAREGLFYTANDRQNSEIFGKQGTFAGVQKSFGIFMAVVLCLMYICLSGVYQSLSTYLMPMSVQGPLHMSKADGNLLLFGYSFSMVVGRLLAVFLSKFFPSQWLLPFEIGLTLGGAIGLYFYSFRSVMFIWVLTCAFSFTSAPIFPAGIAWSEIYLEITGPLMAVFFAGGGFGTLIFQWLSGYGIQNHGVFFPIYVNLGATVATAVLFLVACIRCWTFGPRQVGDKQTLDESNRHVQQSKADEQSPLIT